jgi:hypothetical protein
MTLDTALAEVVGAAMAPLAEQIDRLASEVAALRAATPSQWISQARASELLGISVQTVTAMGRRGEIVTRKAGRRVLVDARSLRPATPEKVATLACEARRRP